MQTPVVPYGSCLGQCLKRQQPSTACAELFAPATGLAIVVGLMCIWWNPRWHHKLDGKDGRLTGLHTYYNIQVIITLQLGFINMAPGPSNERNLTTSSERGAQFVSHARAHSRNLFTIWHC